MFGDITQPDPGCSTFVHLRMMAYANGEYDELMGLDRLRSGGPAPTVASQRTCVPGQDHRVKTTMAAPGPARASDCGSPQAELEPKAPNRPDENSQMAPSETHVHTAATCVATGISGHALGTGTAKRRPQHVSGPRVALRVLVRVASGGIGDVATSWWVPSVFRQRVRRWRVPGLVGQRWGQDKVADESVEQVANWSDSAAAPRSDASCARAGRSLPPTLRVDGRSRSRRDLHRSRIAVPGAHQLRLSWR
jgi:hypothetical protein